MKEHEKDTNGIKIQALSSDEVRVRILGLSKEIAKVASDGFGAEKEMSD